MMKKLGFDCMRLPLNDPNDQESIDYKQTCDMFAYFFS